MDAGYWSGRKLASRTSAAQAGIRCGAVPRRSWEHLGRPPGFLACFLGFQPGEPLAHGGTRSPQLGPTLPFSPAPSYTTLPREMVVWVGYIGLGLAALLLASSSEQLPWEFGGLHG